MSTEQKHTPGPWKVIENGNLIQIGGCWHSTEPVLEVAIVTRFKLQNGMHDANARLIAAAPELLEACKRIMRVYNEGWRLDPNDAACVRDAIAKATNP